MMVPIYKNILHFLEASYDYIFIFFLPISLSFSMCLIDRGQINSVKHACDGN